jgi:hypothetical protein
MRVDLDVRYFSSGDAWAAVVVPQMRAGCETLPWWPGDQEGFSAEVAFPRHLLEILPRRKPYGPGGWCEFLIQNTRLGQRPADYMAARRSFSTTLSVTECDAGNRRSPSQALAASMSGPLEAAVARRAHRSGPAFGSWHRTSPRALYAAEADVLTWPAMPRCLGSWVYCPQHFKQTLHCVILLR